MASLVITSVISAVMPLALSLSGYAYWQLFSLYLSFAGFFMLGFNDGIYQRFARRPFGDVERRELGGHFRTVVVLCFLSASTVALTSLYLPSQKRFAVLGVAASLTFFGVMGFMTYVQQLAGSLEIVAYSTILERLVLLGCTLCLVVSGYDDYRGYVAACVLASAARLVYLWCRTRRIFLRPPSVESSRVSEFREVTSQGFPIMLSILLSGSIVIPSRLVVERYYGPESFALYSFALTVVFVAGAVLTSVSQAAFPMLARVAERDQVGVVQRAHSTLVVAGSVLLLFYFLADFLITKFYPSFIDSLDFLVFLFPLLIFQSKHLLLLCNVMRARERLWRLVIMAASGMLINWVVAAAAVSMTYSVVGLSVLVLVGYGIWQSIWWRVELGGRALVVHRWDLVELVLVVAFVVCTTAPGWLHLRSGALPVSVVSYLCVLLALGLCTRSHTGAAIGMLTRRLGGRMRA